MKLNRKNKKGFTVVELVIVIGVIGILSAILIPTFANLTNKANESRAKEEVSGAYTLYIQDAIDLKLHNEDSQDEIAVSGGALGQSEVVIKREDKFYVYSSEKGWTTEGAPTTAPAAANSFGLYNTCEVFKKA